MPHNISAPTTELDKDSTGGQGLGTIHFHEDNGNKNEKEKVEEGNGNEEGREGNKTSGKKWNQDKGKEKKWDELCIGFWRMNKLSRMQGLPGDCWGINVVRAESEADLSKKNELHTSGIKVLIIAEKNNEAANQGDNNTHLSPNRPIKRGISRNVYDMISTRIKQSYTNAVALCTDENYKNEVKQNTLQRVTKQTELTKKMFEKAASGEMIWKTTGMAKKIIETQVQNTIDWIKTRWSP